MSLDTCHITTLLVVIELVVDSTINPPKEKITRLIILIFLWTKHIFQWSNDIGIVCLFAQKKKKEKKESSSCMYNLGLNKILFYCL